MFGKITIIGVGLIGGSLGLACKNNQVAKYVSGCSRSNKNIKTALKLGLIDSGYTDPVKAVEGADLIILCTPLSAYADIVKKISPVIKNGTVITDAGSVKYRPTREILDNLRKEQKPFFVPGHPIAGTERSGPEASSPDLFKGRITILTPFIYTNPSAISKVTDLWNGVGSNMIIMDFQHHDIVYAKVSHNVQYISSCYSLMLEGLRDSIKKEIKSDIDNNFKRFFRLAGSDPIMWRDIFTYNRKNIFDSINQFSINFRELKRFIEAGNTVRLKNRLTRASDKRLKFRKFQNKEEKLSKSSFKNMSPVAFSAMILMPRIISCAIMMSTDEDQYAYAAGAGFQDVTRNIILDNANETSDIFNHSHELLELMEDFANKINQLKKTLNKEKGNPEETLALLQKAKDNYAYFLDL